MRWQRRTYVQSGRCAVSLSIGSWLFIFIWVVWQVLCRFGFLATLNCDIILWWEVVCKDALGRSALFWLANTHLGVVMTREMMTRSPQPGWGPIVLTHFFYMLKLKTNKPFWVSILVNVFLFYHLRRFIKVNFL